MSKLKSLTLIFISFFVVNCLKDNEDMTISITSLYKSYSGKKRTILL